MIVGRRGWLAALFVTVALAVLALAPVTAGAADYTNQECLACHDKVSWNMSFDVGPVDKNTACRKCHLDNFAGAHPIHNQSSNCGAFCHPGWGEALASNVPQVLDTSGAFNSPSSQDTTAGVLHIIHANPRWVQGLSTTNSKCGSCHAAASCTACHDGTIPPSQDASSHAGHASWSTSTSIVPWVGDLSPGVTGGDETQDTKMVGTSLRCGAAGCHDMTGIASASANLMDNFNHDADPASGYVTTTVGVANTWKYVYSRLYSRDQMMMSNKIGAEVSIDFVGERVTLVTDKDPYRGIAEILIDNVSQGTVDLYNGVTLNQVPVWTSNALGAGTHNIKIRVTGTMSGSARGTWISFDQLKVWEVSPDTVAPECKSCHTTKKSLPHGSDLPTIVPTFTHDATQTSDNTWNTGYGTYRCDSCHVSNQSTSMQLEHRRSTSSSNYKQCTPCHTLYAPYTWTATWNTNDGCNYGSCHPSSASTRTAHAAVVTSHTPLSGGYEDTCKSCHAGDLRVVHYNSKPGNGILENAATTCNACHTQSLFNTARSCVDAGCHVGSGVTSMTAHSFDTTRHTPTNFTRAYQTTSTLDDGGVECNVCHSARLDTAHSTPGTMTAVGCSKGGAGNKGCHEDTAYNSRSVAASGWPADKCSECHNYAGKKSHDQTATAHFVASNGCAGSTAGCHNSNDLWTIHKNSKPGNGILETGGGCTAVDGANDPYGCHNTLDKRPTVNSANACGSTSTGCHTDHDLGSHPGAMNHAFSNVSYYNATSEVGCTNQTGCHNNSGGSTTDFGSTYHPTSGCTPGGACHSSTSKPSFTGILPTDCQECHGGAFVGAPSRNSLTASPSAGGHYSETTHTAIGTNMTVAVKSDTTGTASATCNNCHSATVGGTRYGLLNQHANVGVAGSPYGAAVGCGECHGDTRAYGNVEVLASWTADKCEDCHKLGGSSTFDHAATVSTVVTDTGALGCGSKGVNCHTTGDLHTLHRNAAGGCNLVDGSGQKCHDYTIQAYKPTAKSCGTGAACHTAYTLGTVLTPATHTKSLEVTAHAPSSTGTTQANATFVAGGQSNTCTACHIVTKADGGLVSYEHTSTYSTKTVDASNICRNCHNNPLSTTAVTTNWSQKDTANGCAQCHTGTLAIHSTENTAAHTVATNTGCGGTGGGCHPKTDLSSVAAVPTTQTGIHVSCMRCHDRTASGGQYAYDPAKKGCGSGRSCHGTGSQYATATAVHNGAGGLADGNDATHHQAVIARSNYGSGQDLVYDGTKECNTCHTDRMTSSHTTTTVGAVGCGAGAGGCHNSSVVTTSAAVVKSNWATKKCTACHTSAVTHTAYQTGAGLQTSHEATSAQGCLNSGAGCHGTNKDLGLLHPTAGCNASVGATTTATKCHDVDKAMNAVSKSCGGAGNCHANYTAANHNGIATGNEVATHETTATGFSTKIDGTTYDTGGNNTCASCHSRGLALAHKETSTTSSLKSGNTSWGATAATICQDCHNTTTPDNAQTVVKSLNWSARTCQQCHDTAGNGGQGNGFHDLYTTGNHTSSVGTTSGADGCITDACHSTGATGDVRAIHNRAKAGRGCTSVGADTKAWSGSCHQLDKQMPLGTMSCGSGGAGATKCHVNHTDTNHGANHGFTTTSNYVAASETGCSNSTSGCHGTESSYADFGAAQYHPTGATTCAGGSAGTCHTSPSKTGWTLHECQDCHKTTGGYTGAAARASLTASPSAGGHYSETTHTAIGTNMTVAVKSDTTGTASATCNNCHSATVGGTRYGLLNQHANVGVAGSPYGAAVGCGECHGDTRAYGNVEVLASWTADKCEDCHKLGGSSTFDHAATVSTVVTDTGALGCGSKGVNCHTTGDLHTLHRNAAGGCNLVDGSGQKCHDYTIQAYKPTAKSCGTGAACHTAYTLGTVLTPATHTKSLEVTAHAPSSTGTTQANATFVAGGQSNTCTACHIVTKADGGLVSYEHTSTYSTKTVDASNICRNCHNNPLSTTAVTTNWSQKDTANGCAQCHTGTLAIHSTENTAAHTVATNTGCGNSGIGCHNTNDLSAVTASPTSLASNAIHNSCLRCHNRTGAATWTSAAIGTGVGVQYNPNEKRCGQTAGCHTSSSYSTSTAQHRIGRGDVVTGDDTKHTASAASMNATIGTGVASASCGTCHTNTLALAHKVTSTTASFDSTHTGWANACTGCHNENRGPVFAAPVVKTNWATGTCAGCHTAYHNKLTSHDSTNTTCGNSGVGCHNSTDLRVLHGQTKTNGCNLSGCHDSKDKAMTAATKDCQAAGCHNAYTASNHGTVTTGNEVATHEATATGFTTKIDGTTYDTGGGNTCTNCHSRALATAHKETSTTAALKSGNTNWATTPGNICVDCHNTTTPDASNVPIKSNWTARTCQQCHDTAGNGGSGNGFHDRYTAGNHTATTGSCALGSCHGGSTDVRAIHNVAKANRGCTTNGVSGACHKLDKQMTPATEMKCGSGSGGCHTAAKYVAGGHGMSTGGTPCYTCHTTYQASMETSGSSRTSTYHHVLGQPGVNNGDIAPNAGTYQTSTTNVFCTSCHSDHNYFNPGPGTQAGANLRTAISVSSGAATNTDYYNSGSYGVCASCHATALAKDTTNQKPGTGIVENTPKVDGAQYANGTHNYAIPSTIGTSTFNGDCVKCHDDGQTTSYNSAGFSLHFGGEKRLLSSLGATPQAGDEAQENLCYRCHSTNGNPYGASGKDGYNVRSMSTTSVNIYNLFQRASHHPIEGGTATVECQSCHNTHLSTTLTETVDPNNTYNRLAYTTDAQTSAFCLRCHDGNTPGQQVDGTTYTPAAVTINPANTAKMDKTAYQARGHWTAGGSISSTETAACAECHDQHGSNAPKLLGVSIAGGANVIGTQTITANNKSVCYGCHVNASTGYGVATASRTASGYPMDGTWPGSAEWETTHNNVTHAGSAHSEPTVVWPGLSYAGGDCKNCHDVHGAKNQYDELRSPTASESYSPVNQEFCFDCHDGTLSTTYEINIAQFYPVSIGASSTADNAGHNIQSPGAQIPVGRGMPCYMCHNPHGSETQYGLTIVTQSNGATITVGDGPTELNMDPTTRTDADVRNFCFTCHTDSLSTSGWNGSTMASVGPTASSVLGISRLTYNTTNKYGLKLPSTQAQHAFSGTASCYSCHLSDYSTPVSYNVHNPSPGVSQGGQSCYGCHSSYQANMEGTTLGASRTSSYHHALGSGTTTATRGDSYYAQGSYPVSTTNVFCLSCHVDHNLFNGKKSSNLRTNLNATAVATNTDFNTATQTGVCQSCHNASKTKDTTNQKPGTGVVESVPLINGANFAASAHNYSVTSTFGTLPYNANCVKCHSDSTLKQYQGVGGKAFAVHWSNEKHLLESLGSTMALGGTDERHELHCYECHSVDENPNGAALTDGHGVRSMTATAVTVKNSFNLTSHHPAELARLQCQSCHNVHIQTGATETADPDNTYNKLNWNTAAEQATYCLKCHDGAPPAVAVSSGTTYVPQPVSFASTATATKSTYGARGHWSAYGAISAGEVMGCGTCHDNHGSDAPKLLGQRKVVSTSTASNVISGTVITANDNTVCGACHTNASTNFSSPAAQSRTTSGFPIDGRFPGMAVYNNATNGIHRAGRSNVTTLGYSTGDCKNCHDVHGSANLYDGLKGTYTQANYSNCFGCHGASGPSTINIQRYFPTTSGGTSANNRAGHKTLNAGSLPAGSSMPCYMCHNAHGSASPDGLQVVTEANNTTITVGVAGSAFDLSTAAGVRQFCFTCHTTDNNNNGWNGTAYATVVSGDLVLGIDRVDTNKRLNLPTQAGHNSTDTESCYQCHGNDYSSANSANVHNPNAGAPANGTIACNGCHGTYSVMASSTASYHHVLDAASPFAAPGAGSYNTSQTALSCTSCHVDHNYFNAAKGANLRTNVLSATSDATNTDYVGAAGSGYGICISCHTAQRAKNTTGQASVGSSDTIAINGALYANSAHNYTVNASFGADVFRPNCSKCHDDEQDSGSKMTSTYKFGTHFSTSSGIARALGATLPVGSHTVEENLCYRCHSGTGAGKDGYGVQTMSDRARNIQSSYTKTYKHAVASATVTGRHEADEYNFAPASVNGTSVSTTGWYGTGLAKRHSECEDCHNPHVARSDSATEFPDANNPRGSTAVTISPSNEGVWGVNITGPVNTASNGDWAGSSAASNTGFPAYPNYSKIATATYEWQLCLKCHSRYAWGNQSTPTVPSNGVGTTGASNMTDVGRDFDPANFAYHPLFQPGRNQPPTTLNPTNWGTAGTARRSVGGNSNNLGFTNTFVDGWFSNSRVTCSDCHGNDTWGGSIARGVHGSSNKWLVRGKNSGIKTTKEGGAVYTNGTGGLATSFCQNCHRQEVYGPGGSSPSGSTYLAMSRASHSGWSSCWGKQTQLTDCQNCHAGRGDDLRAGGTAVKNGSVHGTSARNRSATVDKELGFRFCNGGAWDDHTFATASGSAACNTVASGETGGYTSCSQHSSGRTGPTPNYYY